MIRKKKKILHIMPETISDCIPLLFTLMLSVSVAMAEILMDGVVVDNKSSTVAGRLLINTDG